MRERVGKEIDEVPVLTENKKKSKQTPQKVREKEIPEPSPSAALSAVRNAAAAAKSLQSYLTLCDPIDSSPPGSAIPGILQARALEWVAINWWDSKED